MELSTVNNSSGSADVDVILSEIRAISNAGLAGTRALRLTRQILGAVAGTRRGLDVPREYKRDAIKSTWDRLRRRD